MVLRVDLDVRDARRGRRHVAEDPAGRPARCAERRGELQQRRPLAELVRPRGALEQRLARGCAAGCGVGAPRRRAPDGCRGTGRRSARGAARRPARRHGDEEDADTCAHVRANDEGRRLPDAGYRHVRCLSRRRTAAGTPPWSPGWTTTEAGSSVVTGRSPTIIEQQESTSAKRGESAWAARARSTRSASGHRTGHLEGVGVGAGGGPRGGPVAQRDVSNARHLVGVQALTFDILPHRRRAVHQQGDGADRQARPPSPREVPWAPCCC